MTGLRYILAVLFTLIFSTAHADDDVNSANFYLPGCQDFIAGTNSFFAGRCVGVIEGLGILERLNHVWCAPNASTSEQWVRVIVYYIEARPERMHEDFRSLAIEALKVAWPCQK
jgi:hypothetical protein